AHGPREHVWNHRHSRIHRVLLPRHADEGDARALPPALSDHVRRQRDDAAADPSRWQRPAGSDRAADGVFPCPQGPRQDGGAGVLSARGTRIERILSSDRQSPARVRVDQPLHARWSEKRVDAVSGKSGRLTLLIHPLSHAPLSFLWPSPLSSCQVRSSRWRFESLNRRDWSPEQRCCGRSTPRCAAPTSICTTASWTSPSRSFPDTSPSASSRMSTTPAARCATSKATRCARETASLFLASPRSAISVIQ